MTAKQKAARAKFKEVVKEASKLRKKNPKLTQAQAVKQAWAIEYSKKRSSKKVAEIGKVKRKVATKKSPVKSTKVKATKRKSTEMHTDTKSHNVNIRVVSGIDDLKYLLKEREIAKQNFNVAKANKNRKGSTQEEKNHYNYWYIRYKNYIVYLNKRIAAAKKHIK